MRILPQKIKKIVQGLTGITDEVWLAWKYQPLQRSWTKPPQVVCVEEQWVYARLQLDLSIPRTVFCFRAKSWRPHLCYLGANGFAGAGDGAANGLAGAGVVAGAANGLAVPDGAKGFGAAGVAVAGAKGFAAGGAANGLAAVEGAEKGLGAVVGAVGAGAGTAVGAMPKTEPGVGAVGVGMAGVVGAVAGGAAPTTGCICGHKRG